MTSVNDRTDRLELGSGYSPNNMARLGSSNNGSWNDNRYIYVVNKNSQFFIKKPIFFVTPLVDVRSNQNYLKLEIENIGEGVADNCKASIEVMKGTDTSDHPTLRKYPLSWGKEYDKSDIQEKEIINPGEEKELHVIFADPKFSTSPFKNARNRHAEISTIKHLSNNSGKPTVEDSFATGDYDAIVRITSIHGKCKLKTHIHIDEDYKKSTIVLSRWDRFKMRVKRVFLKRSLSE